MYQALTEKIVEQLLDNHVIIDPIERALLKPQLEALEGPIPAEFKSQYLNTYVDYVKRAHKHYRDGLQRIDNDIKDICNYEQSCGRIYTPEQKETDKKKLLQHLQNHFEKDLLVAEMNSNDLENFADALLWEWRESGSPPTLMY
jgi:hypothetical protein